MRSRSPRVLGVVVLCLALIVAGAGVIWWWDSAREPGRAIPTAVHTASGAGSQEPGSAVIPSPSPTPSPCERYLHESNLDAGCLEPSGALTATIRGQTLDTTDAHVSCERDGYRLAINVDTPERLHDEGSFWGVLWGKDAEFDALEIGVGYGRRGPDGEGLEHAYYHKDDDSNAPPPVTVSREGRTLTITGTTPAILDQPATPFTMAVTCPTDF